MAGKLIVKFVCENTTPLYKVVLYIDGEKQNEKIGRGETKAFTIDKESFVYGQFGTIGGLKTSSVKVSADKTSEIVFGIKADGWKTVFEIVDFKEGETPAAEVQSEVEKPVYEFDGGVGDRLTVYEDRVIIKHKGVLNFMAMGIHGDKTIYYSDLTAIQYKAGGLLAGHIQFSMLGGNESRGGVLNAASDENTITFNQDKNSEAQEICEYLNNKLREIKSAKNAPIVQAAPVSAAEEIKKFKELLDMGILTQEEFDAKKKQLLGL